MNVNETVPVPVTVSPAAAQAAAANGAAERRTAPAQTASPAQTAGANGGTAPANAGSVPVNASGVPINDAEFEKIMEEPIRQANKGLAPFSRRIEREFHEITGTLMYKIKDTKTDEVIAEYPPRKIQDMVAKMWELAGLFVDEKA